MKITNNIGFNNINYQTRTKKLVTNSLIDSTSKNEIKKFNFPTISFSAQKDKSKPPLDFKLRVAILKAKHVDYNFAAELAYLPSKQYLKALQLVGKGIKAECIAELTELKDDNYKKALYLADKGVVDFHLHTISSLDENKYQKALDFLNKGIDSDCINLFANLNEQELKETERLLREGYPPIIAGHFSRLTEDEREFAQIFIDKEAEPEVAAKIAKFDEEKKQKCTELLFQGIDPEFVSEIADFNDKEQERLQELLKLKVDSQNIPELAKLSEEDYEIAIKMLKDGVNDSYVNFIIEIETGKAENEEYTEYRSRNYSRTTAFSLSLLSNAEIDALTRIRKKNPILYKLMEDEYEITIADIQNENITEAILTKQIRTPNGTKITLVRTFDEHGEETKSRTEEYKDNSVSSIMKNAIGTFKTKYDKYGEIRELTEFMTDSETGEVTGVIHSKASKLLSGVFESTYYNISEFKEDNGDEGIDTDIENSVLSSGEPISKVVKNDDGSITYTESIQLNNIMTDRFYTEKRDKNNEIIFSSYEYQIQDENSKIPMMNISRTWKKDSENTVINTINGITYKIHFDDKNKTIKISDGSKSKEIQTLDKLPYYSSEILWKEIKKLHVDTLLNIFEKIEKWNYCADGDSVASSYTKTLSTGTNNSIIYHEAGHLIANEKPSILDNQEFVETYGKEMEAFKSSLPYNEQEYVQYFSPRAGIIGSDGADEFVAESNILLTTYGTTNYKIKTRTAFLEKYFPKTIAKVAEITGKNSRESLLK